MHVDTARSVLSSSIRHPLRPAEPWGVGSVGAASPAPLAVAADGPPAQSVPSPLSFEDLAALLRRWLS